MGDDFFGEEQVAPAAEQSPLADLRSRRARRRERMFFERPVPGMEPPIYLRFKPVEQGKFIAAAKRVEKAKNDDAVAVANAALLVDACVGVFEYDGDGHRVSVDPADRSPDPADWPRIDQRLGELIADEGQTLTRASDTARALFDNDMALGAMADEVLEWSRSMNETLEEEHAGN